MASGNRVSENVAAQDVAGSLDTREELERVKEYLKEVMRKNQDLEEMLLYTAQELEKEMENSRKIVQTLTERLMESREMINKLEVENMRYKKDCMLAIELLQCNRIVDPGQVSMTVKKLSDYTDPVGHHTYRTGSPFAVDENKHTNVSAKATKDEIRNIQPSRPRTLSKKKKQSEASNEDTTALLDKQETNETEVKISRQVGSSPTREDKIAKEDKMLEYHKDLRDDQCEQTPDKTDQSGLPSMIDNSQQKQSYNPPNFADEGMNVASFTNKDICLKERECLTDECHQEGKPLIGNKNSKSTGNQVELNSVEPEGPNNEGSRPKNETACLSDESLQEDKPLIVNKTKSSTQQSINTPEANENIKLRGENAHTVNLGNTESRDTVHKVNSNVGKSTSLISTPTTRAENEDIPQVKAMQDDAIDNENDKLLHAERSEEKHTSQQVSSESNMGVPKLAIFEEDNSIKTDNNEAEVVVSIDNDERSSVDDSTLKESETESNDGEVATKFGEAEDETLTAEENTPLV